MVTHHAHEAVSSLKYSGGGGEAVARELSRHWRKDLGLSLQSKKDKNLRELTRAQTLGLLSQLMC